MSSVQSAESMSTGGSSKERSRRHRSRTRVSPSSTAPGLEEPGGLTWAPSSDSTLVRVPIGERRRTVQLPPERKSVDAGTSMAPPEIRSIKAQTYLQLEMGILQRRRAMLFAVQKAREELGRLCASRMPPLLWQTRRNAELSLEVPLGCDCTPEERLVLSSVLWQEEKREDWLEQQAEECSSLLRRAEEKLQKLAKQDTLKPKRSPGNTSGAVWAPEASQMPKQRESIMDWDTKMSGGGMDDEDDGGAPGKELRIECGNPVSQCVRFFGKHLSTRSSTAMDSAANPRERVRRHDARTALLLAMIIFTAFPLPLIMRSVRGAHDSFLSIDPLAAANQTIEALICESGGNYSMARTCVEETDALRQQEYDDAEAEEIDRAYRQPRGILLSVMQCCVALVPVPVMAFAPWTFWPLLQHNIDYIILRFLAGETQVRLVVIMQTIALLLVFTNVVFLDSTGMHGRIERAYIVIESWLTFTCILVLVGCDALHHKPFYTLAVIYTSVNLVLLFSFLSRRSSEIEREQTVLFTTPASFTSSTQVLVQNVLELLDSATLTLLLTNYKDFLLEPRLTVWAPIKLSRHDLLNAIYLQKVRFAFFERNKLYRLLGLRTSAAEKEVQKEYHIDAELLIHHVTVIQRRWRLIKARKQCGCNEPSVFWKTTLERAATEPKRSFTTSCDGPTRIGRESRAVARRSEARSRSSSTDSRQGAQAGFAAFAGSKTAAVRDELQRMRSRKREGLRSEQSRSRTRGGRDARRERGRTPTLGETPTARQSLRRSTLNVFASGHLRGSLGSFRNLLSRGSSKQLVANASPLGSAPGCRAGARDETHRSPHRSPEASLQNRVTRRADHVSREIDAVEQSLRSGRPSLLKLERGVLSGVF